MKLKIYLFSNSKQCLMFLNALLYTYISICLLLNVLYYYDILLFLKYIFLA